MTPSGKPLGIMRPLGGGDPITLKKTEMVIGRRKTCDIRLDFENVSGRHCELRFMQGVWHVRDLKSTNGTTVNGQPIFSEHEVMPDDALGVAGHMFMIDYDPVAPTSLMDAKMILEEEMSEEGGRRRTLLEMAGIAGDRESSYRMSRMARKPQQDVATDPVPLRDPEESSTATDLDPVPKPLELNDDEFLNLIRDDLKPN
jgi:predicted component of type VI protein secretion system